MFWRTHQLFSASHLDVNNTFLQYVIIPLQKTLRRDKIPILFQLLLPKFYHKKDGVNNCFESFYSFHVFCWLFMQYNVVLYISNSHINVFMFSLSLFAFFTSNKKAKNRKPWTNAKATNRGRARIQYPPVPEHTNDKKLLWQWWDTSNASNPIVLNFHMHDNSITQLLNQTTISLSKVRNYINNKIWNQRLFTTLKSTSLPTKSWKYYHFMRIKSKLYHGFI